MDEHLLYERIKQYQNRQLPEAERLAFEAQLKSDPAFAEEVAILAAIYQGIQEKGDAELNQELFTLGQSLLQADTGRPEMTARVNPEQIKRRASIPRWIYAAAALVLLLVCSWPLYQRFNRGEDTYASAETLYTEHFRMPDANVVRDAGASAWRDAYTQHRYPDAIAELDKLLNDPNYARRSEAFLYRGLAYLGLGQAEKALADFEQVGSDSFSWEDAQWFKAMTYLKMNEVPKAKALLQAIAGKAGDAHQQEAEGMLKQIK